MAGADLRTPPKSTFKSQFEQMLSFVHTPPPCTALRFRGGRPSAPDGLATFKSSQGRIYTPEKHQIQRLLPVVGGVFQRVSQIFDDKWSLLRFLLSRRVRRLSQHEMMYKVSEDGD